MSDGRASGRPLAIGSTLFRNAKQYPRNEPIGSE